MVLRRLRYYFRDLVCTSCVRVPLVPFEVYRIYRFVRENVNLLVERQVERDVMLLVSRAVFGSLAYYMKKLWIPVDGLV